MENFLTAAKLHVHAKRFMDAYSSRCSRSSAEFATRRRRLRFCCFSRTTRKTAPQRTSAPCGGSSPALSRCTSTRLVTLGFLERKSVPGDRRKLHLEPTEKASSIIARGRQMQERFAQTLAPGAEPEELSCFARCMETISQNLERAATGME